LGAGEHLMDSVPTDFVRKEVARTIAVLNDMLADEPAMSGVRSVAELCVAAIRGGHKIMFAGNGGSAADAQHLAAELVGKLAYDRPGLPALSLTTDTSI